MVKNDFSFWKNKMYDLKFLQQMSYILSHGAGALYG